MNSQITAAEILEAKRLLQEKITAAVKDFEQTVGTPPSKIEIEFLDGVGGNRRLQAISIEVKI